MVLEVIFEPKRKTGKKTELQVKEEEEYWFKKRTLLLENIKRDGKFKPIDLKDVAANEVTKGIQTIKGYVTALCSLWTEQQSPTRPHPFPYPRTSNITTFIQRLDSLQTDYKDKSFVDRGKGTVEDLVCF